MKYKKFDKPTDGSPQSFTPYEKDYVLDPESNSLKELKTPRNVQDYIDSYIDCALNRALEKFMPKVTAESPEVVQERYSSAREDLASVADYIEIAEYYREELGLSDNLSVEQVYAEIDKYSKKLEEQLNSYKSSKDKLVKTECDKNE